MPKPLRYPSLILFLSLLLGSCAQYRAQYGPDVSNWTDIEPDPSLKLRHTVYLMGDGGGTKKDVQPPGLAIWAEHLKEARTNSTVVYLGDNIYPDGMAPKSLEEERQADELALVAQLEPLKEFPGQIYLIAGNHDWYGYGLRGVNRQRKFVENYLGRKDIWGPDCGCGDPTEIDLDENLVLILFDSQWWLENWRSDPAINQDCEVKSRAVFRLYAEEAIKSNRDKNLILATHHPLFSHGPHGGSFTWKEHLFPLTEANKNLWLPLPIFGSLYPLLRSTVGSKQDLAHPDYRDFKNILLNAARKNGRFIFVSGHEHTLQYIRQEEQHFIVSGSGSKKNAVFRGSGTQFSEGNQGFAKILFYEDGSSWVEFWSAKGERPKGQLAFRYQLNGPLSNLTMTARTPTTFTLPQDSIEASVGGDAFDRSNFGRWLWGNHYRDAYKLETKVALLNLDTFRNGVIPVKRGGGYQTNSLRLEAKNKQQYTMRSLDKDPTRLVAEPINQSKIVLDLIKDSFSGAHPLAALAIPPMANAAQVYHTNPELFYVPEQPALLNFNFQFADALYLVEERPDDDHWENKASFGNPRELMSTHNMLEEIAEKHHHVLDWDWILRSRLFDIVLGDWDRHDDQWRWAQIDQGDQQVYRPVPRDRDQAFSEYDGFLFGIARNTLPSARTLRRYKAYQPNIRWSNYGSRYFDASFLSGQEWKDWQREIEFLQQNLTDEIIDQSFQQNWPEAFYDLDGKHIAEVLKGRRDNLLRMGKEFYRGLAKKVDVVGTEKKDLFLIERLSNDSVRVSVYDTNKKGKKENQFYQRTFSTKATKQLNLYGLGGEDFFQWEGKVNKSILVRAIGGEGDDHFQDQSKVSGLKRKTRIYDSPEEENTFETGKESRIHLRKDPEFNTYNRLSRDHEKNHWLFLPSIGFNPDDGVLLGVGAQHVRYGFKKSPHANSQYFGGRYAFSTNGFELFYRGEFIDAIGNWEIGLNAHVQSPLYTINFYGFGNGSEDLEDELGDDFHQVRKQSFSFSPTLMKYRNSASIIKISPTLEGIEIQQTDGRILDSILNIFTPEVFEGQLFAGGKVEFEYQNYEGGVYPEKGSSFMLDFGWKGQVDRNDDRHFFYLKSSLSFLLPLDKARSLTFGTRFGVHHNFSGGFYFYQAAQLGGTGPESNFRGLRRYRYIGQTAFYQNIDLRWKIFTSENKAVPFAIGLLGGFDHGRVWGANEGAELVFDSNKWHIAYGGGLFINPMDIFSIQFSAFRADSDPFRYVVGGKFFF